MRLRSSCACLRVAALMIAVAACGDKAGPGSRASGPHADLLCVDCHAAPVRGRFVAAVADAKCASCHATGALAEQVEVAHVTFAHATHPGTFTGEVLPCGACHGHAAGDRELTVATGSCYLCHADLPGSGTRVNASLSEEGCRECHVQPAHTALLSSGAPIDHGTVLVRGISCLLCHYDVVVGTGHVPEPTCRSCHGIGGGPLALRDDRWPADSVHAAHASPATDFGCGRCHEPVEHQVIQLASALALQCEECHRADDPLLRQPVDSAAHRAEQALYAGLDPHHTAAEPAVKFLERVACTSCHSTASMAVPATTSARIDRINTECVSCHGPRFGSLLPAWVAGMRSHTANAATFVAGAAADARIRRVARADSAARRAVQTWRFVDSAGGVHNLPAADTLLRAATADAERAYRLAGLQPPARPVMGPAPAVDSCVRCHYGVETLRGEMAGQPFEHDRHVIDATLECGACHSAADLFLPDGRTFDPLHGQTRVTAAQCATCHHVDRPGECIECHTRSEVDALSHRADITVQIQRDDVQRSRPVDFHHGTHESLACGECHEAGTLNQRAATCASCHDRHHAADVPAVACAACHGPDPKAQHQRVDHLQCGACHEQNTLRLLGPADREFCLQCHRDLADHRPEGECSECHLQLSPQETMRRMLNPRGRTREPE